MDGLASGDFASVGECMVELAPTGDGLYRQGFAGDTLNTAWYVRGLMPDGGRKVRYVSAVGRDALSDSLLAFLSDNGIDTAAVARLSDRTVGLYLITLAGAERSFTYWRTHAAARCLASDPARLRAALDGVGTAYLSGITLAILEPDDRVRLFSILADFRADGGEVVFDPNIRPRLWDDGQTMARVTTEGYLAATIALPTFPDEADVYGDGSPRETADRIAALGVREVVVKNGPEPALLRVAGEPDLFVPALTEVQPIDTTGAGDSFSGGYIAARLAGRSPFEAATLGHAVAARVIRHRGALAPFTAVADLAVF
jgi:2-dehydro-3-deoxygluconokinase